MQKRLRLLPFAAPTRKSTAPAVPPVPLQPAGLWFLNIQLLCDYLKNCSFSRDLRGVGPVTTVAELKAAAGAEGHQQSPFFAMLAVVGAYLVKKNLDGYVPVQQRAGSVTKLHGTPKTARGKSKTASPTLTATLKPKRGATKRLDSATWYQDSLDSEESEAAAYLTDDCEVPSSTGHGADLAQTLVTMAMPSRGRSLLSEPHRASTKVLHITSTAQLKGLKGLSSEDVDRLFEPSLRSKPRKPMHPRISVVF
ncbi:hypothetical protein KSW81_006886 [Nannochloris sp. 'desiccata']|nr:hypothetical protein KSW81_006886 [Chlorella desiccata (nom. nud.)]